MHTALSTMIDRLEEPALNRANIIPWGCPVPSFGDLSRAKVATLGLNPSNREFVDVEGIELAGLSRRFHTLKSLELARWSNAKSRHISLILESCRSYFLGNPYNGWFKKLDQLISGTKASYYDTSANACHLDLVPYATMCKWAELTPHQRSSLLSVAGDTLGLLLQDSPVRLLVLNGNSVVDILQEISGTHFDAKTKPNWTLPRHSNSGVAGIAYRGTVRHIAGIRLKHEVMVLGYNHNIQSSFGVTNQVKDAIRDWIAVAAGEVIP